MAPTPMIDPLIVCVVLTGMPANAVPISVIAPAVSAVRWGVAGRILWAWILTIPASATVAAATWILLRLVGV